MLSGVGGNVQGCNTFAYCINNPVNLYDPMGLKGNRRKSKFTHKSGRIIDRSNKNTHATVTAVKSSNDENNLYFKTEPMVCDSFFVKTVSTVEGLVDESIGKDKIPYDNENLEQYVENNRYTRCADVEYTINTSYGTSYNMNPTITFTTTSQVNGVIMIHETTYELKHGQEALTAAVLGLGTVTFLYAPVTIPVVAAARYYDNNIKVRI